LCSAAVSWGGPTLRMYSTIYKPVHSLMRIEGPVLAMLCFRYAGWTARSIRAESPVKYA